MQFRIRDARVEDVPALANLHVQTFTETPRGGRPGGPSVELREQQWGAALAAPDARSLHGERGEFNGGYGWRDLPRLVARCDET